MPGSTVEGSGFDYQKYTPHAAERGAVPAEKKMKPVEAKIEGVGSNLLQEGQVDCINPSLPLKEKNVAHLRNEGAGEKGEASEIFNSVIGGEGAVVSEPLLTEEAIASVIDPSEKMQEKSLDQLAVVLECDSKELRKAFEKGENEFFAFLVAREDKLVDYLLISQEMLASKKLEGEDEYRAYIAKKMDKYGPGGEFESSMHEARKQFQMRALEGESGGLSEYTVKKAYRHALRTLEASKSPQEGISFAFDPQKSKEEKHFLARINSAGNLQLVNWSGKILREKHEELLGVGSFAAVQKVYDVGNRRIGAFKVAEPITEDWRDKSERDIILEVRNLREIHKMGPCPGVMTSPWMVFNLTAKAGGKERKIVGCVGAFYEKGDLEEFNKQFIDGRLGQGGRVALVKAGGPDKAQLEEMVSQIFTGLQAVHRVMVHGDLKPKNVLVGYDEKEKQWRLSIGDFANARPFKYYVLNPKIKLPLDGSKFLFGTSFSSGYFTRMDHIRTVNAIRERDEKKWRELEEKRDVFAAAVTAWELLTKTHPYNMHGDVPNTSAGINYFTSDKVNQILGKKKAEILKQALAEDPFKRPSIERILEVFSEAK